MQSEIPFCTYKILTYNRVGVFFSEESYNLLFDAISFLRKKFKIDIYAYLLMSNQVQLITSIELVELESDFTDKIKTITKKNTVKALENKGDNKILELLEIAKGKKKYRLWEVNADVEAATGLEKLEKKITSIHSKPVQANLVEEPALYQFSSAKFYELEKPTEIKIQDYRNIFY